MLSRLITLAVLLCSVSLIKAQDMVISEYYNIQDVNGEWTELVVVKDNLNAVGFVLTDANTGQVLRMGGPKFKDIPLWRNLRAGTIIVVWHRDIPAGITKDIDARDGYLEVSSRDTDLFTIYLLPMRVMCFRSLMQTKHMCMHLGTISQQGRPIMQFLLLRPILILVTLVHHDLIALQAEPSERTVLVSQRTLLLLVLTIHGAYQTVSILREPTWA
jgi:hypothetical protein